MLINNPHTYYLQLGHQSGSDMDYAYTDGYTIRNNPKTVDIPKIANHLINLMNKRLNELRWKKQDITIRISQGCAHSTPTAQDNEYLFDIYRAVVTNIQESN